MSVSEIIHGERGPKFGSEIFFEKLAYNNRKQSWDRLLLSLTEDTLLRGKAKKLNQRRAPLNLDPILNQTVYLIQFCDSFNTTNLE